jgi:hypothetical protein
MSSKTPYDIDAAAIFKTALDTARRARKSDDYRTAAHWANEAAAEAPYGSKENYWVQAEELNAMADTLKEPEALQPHEPLRVAFAVELHRLQNLPKLSTTQANVKRDLEIALGLTSAKPQTVAAAWKRARKALGLIRVMRAGARNG